ncbi:MAG: hypothetical protein ACI4HI_06650 [Lachnospiraceae bacterium]
METYIRWYFLQVKAWCKKRENWFVLAGLMLLFFCMTKIQLPNGQNVRIGFVAQGQTSEELQNALDQMDSVFEFCAYKEEEKLKKDVAAAKLECGFVLDSQFEKKLQAGDTRRLFICYSSTLSNKQSVAQETLYAAFFQLYSDTFLKDASKEIFEQPDTMVQEMLVEKNHAYQSSDEIFSAELTPISVQDQKNKQEQTYPLQGVAAVLLFLLLFLEQGKKFDASASHVTAALELSQRRIFRYLHTLAAGTIPCMAILLLILTSKASRGITCECVSMFIFWGFGSLYITALGSLFKNETTFTVWGIPFAVAQLLLCPVFVDLSAYIPAVGILANLFPVEWYLCLFG